MKYSTFFRNTLFLKPFAGILGVLSLTYSMSVNAKVVAIAPEITDYQLQCDQVFACPQIIDRRVDFWINVFHKWKKQNRILHDSRRPERVYMVLDTEDICSRKNPKGEVRSSIKIVKNRLDELSVLLSNGVSQSRLQKHPYYKLFINSSANDVSEAKNTIRCQSGNRELFTKALQNFKIYKPYILNALQKQNLPMDIQYLPFVESSYNPKAFSFAGAAGMWQIMPRTARSLGLQVGSSIDERFEPEFATLAAAKYFRDSIDRLSKTAQEKQHSTLPRDINPFVITSYNYGVRGMQRAIEQVGTDYEKLLEEYKSASFQTAVRNFYASFLAARHVAQNQETFFPNINLQQQQTPVNRIPLPKALFAKQIAATLNVPKKELEELNPGITYRVWRNQQAVPTGYLLKVPFKDGGWQQEASKLQGLKGVTQGSGSDDSGRRHKVRKGQTACGIGNRYKVRCKDLIKLNSLNRKAVVKIGQRLKIPGGVQKYRATEIVKASQQLRLELESNVSITTTDASYQSINDGSVAVNTADALRLESPKQIVKKQTPPNANNTNLSEKNEQLIGTTDQGKSIPNKVVNLDTSIKQKNGRYWVDVLPSESIGLYSDWLRIGGSKKIRQLNNLRSKGSIQVFQRVYLPVTSKQQENSFNLSRNEYHIALQLHYFQRFKVAKVISRPVKASETMWTIAKNNRIPMWLLMQYNREIHRSKSVRIPIIKPKS